MTEDDYWMGVTEKEDFEAKFFDDPTISTDDTVKAVTEALGSPQSILEIGCGYGRIAGKVKEAFPQSEVTGIDINKEIIKRGLGDVKYLVSNKIPEGKWDAIYSVTVFQHLPSEKKQKYISDAAKSLNKDGVLLVQFIEGERDNFVDHWATPGAMEGWFEEAGLKIESIENKVHPQWSWIKGIK